MEGLVLSDGHVQQAGAGFELLEDTCHLDGLSGEGEDLGLAFGGAGEGGIGGALGVGEEFVRDSADGEDSGLFVNGVEEGFGFFEFLEVGLGLTDEVVEVTDVLLDFDGAWAGSELGSELGESVLGSVAFGTQELDVGQDFIFEGAYVFALDGGLGLDDALGEDRRRVGVLDDFVDGGTGFDEGDDGGAFCDLGAAGVDD